MAWECIDVFDFKENIFAVDLRFMSHVMVLIQILLGLGSLFSSMELVSLI